MPEASLVHPPHTSSKKGFFGRTLNAVFRVFRTTISSVTKPLVVAATVIRVHRFRRDVMKEMRLTVLNLHPEIRIGGVDRNGWYAEIYLNLGGFRLRVTRAIYNRRQEDLWADIGSASDPAAFFRMDYVITALRKLDKSGEVPELLEPPKTLAALDATIWAVHRSLAEHLSAIKFGETKRMIQQVMRDDAAVRTRNEPFQQAPV